MSEPMRGYRRFFAVVVGACVASTLLSACATTVYPPLPASEINKPPVSYTLDAGDKLRVTVYREPELSGEFAVGSAGQISLPLIGEVPVKGLGRAEVEAEITRRLANGLLRDPRVAVDIYAVRSFAILGEVQRPGTFPAEPGTGILDAIALAGGYTYRANEKRILLRRGKQGVFYEVGVDQNVQIEPGDTIKVEEVHF